MVEREVGSIRVALRLLLTQAEALEDQVGVGQEMKLLQAHQVVVEQQIRALLAVLVHQPQFNAVVVVAVLVKQDLLVVLVELMGTVVKVFFQILLGQQFKEVAVAVVETMVPEMELSAAQEAVVLAVVVVVLTLVVFLERHSKGVAVVAHPGLTQQTKAATAAQES